MKVLVIEEIKYLTKFSHEVNDYPMFIINKVAQQELNYSQNKNRRAKITKLIIEFS